MMVLNYRVQCDGEQCNAMEMNYRGLGNGDKM
jgi:hypothetical protein